MKQVESASQRLSHLETTFKELVVYFGELPTIQSDEFFLQVNAFILAYEKAKKDNIMILVLEQKAKLLEERRKKIFEKHAGGQPPEDEGVLENLITELTSGAAFSQKAVKHRKSSYVKRGRKQVQSPTQTPTPTKTSAKKSHHHQSGEKHSSSKGHKSKADNVPPRVIDKNSAEKKKRRHHRREKTAQ